MPVTSRRISISVLGSLAVVSTSAVALLASAGRPSPDPLTWVMVATTAALIALTPPWSPWAENNTQPAAGGTAGPVRVADDKGLSPDVTSGREGQGMSP
jgi:hypothetical protein